MEILRQVLLVLHFVGLASLLGGVMVQLTSLRSGSKVNSAMFHGALTQLVTGVALVGVIQGAQLGDVDNVKIGVKLAIVVIIAVLVFAFRKKETPAKWVVPAIGLLTLANIVIAVMWR
jgi:hypothetical protein